MIITFQVQLTDAKTLYNAITLSLITANTERERARERQTKKEKEKEKETLTCEDVLRQDVDLDFHRVFGRIGDLGTHVGHLPDEHRVEEVCALHPGQRSYAAVLRRGEAL